MTNKKETESEKKYCEHGKEVGTTCADCGGLCIAITPP